MQKMKNLPNAPISLIVVPHIPNHKLDDEIIPFYRRSLVEMTLYALQTLPPSGMLIVGVQDYRATDNTLIPLTALVYQDINDVIKGRDHMKLKELVVCVPQGYSCDRAKEYSKIPKQHCVVGEKLGEVGHLPIVHVRFYFLTCNLFTNLNFLFIGNLYDLYEIKIILRLFLDKKSFVFNKET
jgi:hypothetical protein